MGRFVHRTVEVNGINMHLVEKGEGPVVLFLHGFPELWYSWRHQIEHLSNCGYRAVAPDLRGYGDTDAPSDIKSYTCFQLLGDIVALIDSLGVDKVFLVGHDWGAALGWYLCQFRPERVKAYVCLSVPFGLVNKRDPTVKPVENFGRLFGDDYYICRFQEYPKMEKELAEAGTPYAMKNMLTHRDPGPIIFPKGKYPPGFNRHMSEDLPHWLTQPDVDVYISKFEKTRFTGGLNYYRNIDTNWELTAPWTGTGISKDIPVRFITGELDLVYTTPGTKEYVHGGSFKKDVPGLEDKFWVQPGVTHFNNQEAAADTTHLIHQFISKFK
ncbi:hypothetical protein QN277_014098 [Acacia crassicarpa]|uniref:soluble epoxide hydrolase n=1 Tax=Acacia crassicarpa TaxID=499986 RepID=A0AAE1N530_9FABA|nr:hypothetical protein QN277_014098 [Acacia crassicarpa]